MTLTPEKKAIIAKMRKEANKAISKVIASTFDTNLRNQRTQEINTALAKSIKAIEPI